MNRPARRAATRHLQRDQLTSMAVHPGIVLVGQVEHPHQLDDDGQHAIRLPAYQADAVHQLLDDAALVRGDSITVLLDGASEPVRGSTVLPPRS